MTRPLLIAAAVLALLAACFFAGWHARGVSDTAASVAATDAGVRALADSVTQQASAQNAHLLAEQGKTLALQAQQDLLQQHSATLQLEITHATFTPPAVDGAATACPDPTGSPEWLRLYNAAGSAADPTAGTTAAGGVHALGPGPHPNAPDRAADRLFAIVTRRPGAGAAEP